MLTRAASHGRADACPSSGRCHQGIRFLADRAESRTKRIEIVVKLLDGSCHNNVRQCREPRSSFLHAEGLKRVVKVTGLGVLD